MKILYVVSRPLEINTSASIRNRATIMGLIENHCDVTVFTTEPDINHEAYDDSLSLKGVNVKTVKLGGNQSVARIGRKLFFLKPLKKLLYKIMSKHDIYDNLKGIVNYVDEIDIEKDNYNLIISSSDPKSSHLFVETLLKNKGEFFNGKWIQIWGDPFLGDISRQDSKKNISLIKSEEKRLLSEADSVVYVSELTLEQQKNNYPDSAFKMRYLPIPYVEKRIYKLQNLCEKDTIEIVYLGDYNSNIRNINPIYNAVKEMKNIHMTICGGSDHPVSSCDNITIYGRVSYKVVKELEEKADILVHLSNSSGSQIPGKIYQYAGTNKPILFILDGNEELLRKQFDKYDRFCFAENSEMDIQVKLNDMILSNREYRPIEELEKKMIASRLIEESN